VCLECVHVRTDEYTWRCSICTSFVTWTNWNTIVSCGVEKCRVNRVIHFSLYFLVSVIPVNLCMKPEVLPFLVFLARLGVGNCCFPEWAKVSCTDVVEACFFVIPSSPARVGKYITNHVLKWVCIIVIKVIIHCVCFVCVRTKCIPVLKFPVYPVTNCCGECVYTLDSCTRYSNFKCYSLRALDNVTGSTSLGGA